MFLPARVQQIVRALHDRHRALSEGTDDQRRQLARMIAEQARFELGPTWGGKRADAGRPPSKDAVAQRQPDGKLFGWDLFNGATGAPHANPNSIDISKQVFIDVSPGVDHLGGAVEPPSKPPSEPPAPPPPPSAGKHPYPDERTWWAQFEREQAALYEQAGLAQGPAHLWSARTAYDIGAGMEPDEAKTKHLAELRKALGLS